jgi:hypothetical protein
MAILSSRRWKKSAKRLPEYVVAAAPPTRYNSGDDAAPMRPSALIPILTHNVTNEIDGFFRLARREEAQGSLLQRRTTQPDGKRRDFMSCYG